MQITANEMYPKDSKVVENLLTDMATMPIVNVGMTRLSTLLSLFSENSKKIDFFSLYRGKIWRHTIQSNNNISEWNESIIQTKTVHRI